MPFRRTGPIPTLRLAPLLVALALTRCGSAPADDASADLPRAAHGTPFHFEVIESLDASYLGDTPSHMGRDGGLEVRPNVALGDPVFRDIPGPQRRTERVGRVTRVAWDRVSGGLTVEFHPEPLVRIAVGDEVWIDLNPAPPPADGSAAGG